MNPNGTLTKLIVGRLVWLAEFPDAVVGRPSRTSEPPPPCFVGVTTVKIDATTGVVISVQTQGSPGE
jgi:hypothetical protein